MSRQASLLAFLLLGAACSASTDDSKRTPPGAAGSSSIDDHGPDPSTVCGESKLGAPRLRRLSRAELSNTLNDVFPELQGEWTALLSADPISTHGFDNDSRLLLVGKQTADELDRTATSLAAAVSGAKLATLLPCAATSKDAACANDFVAKYGKRLFRRALTADEAGRYAQLFQAVSAAKGFESGIAYVARALVQSPHVVYRREIGSASGADYTLTPSEIATALAYDFSGSPPSEALLARADAGELATPAAREAAARELLATDKGLATVEKFFDSWLGYGRASSVTKANVPEFEQLRDQMVAETRRFLGEVVVTQAGGLRELLTAPLTAPSVDLARFYGFPAPSADYAVTPRPAGRGVGILAQGALLSALSGPAASSPTQRGLLVMERLLCREKPMAPPTVPVLGPPQPGMLTTRQRYESTHAQGSCKTCHLHFDPIGFGFEHFDEAGRYRDTDGGLPVDAVSYVPNGEAHLFDFSSLEQLAQGLAEQRISYECATGYLSTYVFGSAEACLGETERPAFISQQSGFIDYLASLAAEPHFAQRRAP